jgi:cellulose synthase/poly-beta-1,6-N-acetylglucosamine synthase-like glycosyltransferase
MIVNILLLIAFTILLLNTLYFLTFAVAGAYYQVKSNDEAVHESSYLFLIPAYKEDTVVLSSVRSVLSIDYPKELFRIVVIADEFRKETINALRDLGAEVFEINANPCRNKAAALQQFLNDRIIQEEAIVLLDADNRVKVDMLHKLNAYRQKGVSILQARRVAGNEDNSLSRLDSLSETLNNHIFRKGQRALGLSASLIGSGIMMDTDLFRSTMRGMNIFSGFDKEMEIRLLRERYTIEYAEDVLVYDEKVNDHAVFVNQRRRWMYAQMFFLIKYMPEACRQLIIHRNLDFFNKVFQFALLPRMLCIGLSVLLIPLTALTGYLWFFAFLAVFCMLAFSLGIGLRGELRKEELPKLALSFPRAFCSLLNATLTSRKAAGRFLHTPHHSTKPIICE